MKKLNQKGMIDVSVIALAALVVLVGALVVWRFALSKDSVSDSTDSAVASADVNPEINVSEIPRGASSGVSSIETIENVVPTQEEDPYNPNDYPDSTLIFDSNSHPYRFSYPTPWSDNETICLSENEPSKYKYTAVMFSTSEKEMPACEDLMRFPENGQINISSIEGTNYPENYLDDLKKNSNYYSSFTHKDVKINGINMVRTETVWSGKGGLMQKGTKTISYNYYDHAKNTSIEATYWQRTSDGDYSSKFEDLVKTFELRDGYKFKYGN